MRPYVSGRLLLFVFFVLGFPSYLRSLARARRPAIRQRWSGDDDIATARRVAVFVHFDPDGHVDDWLVHYLRELRRGGFAVIFVSNAPSLSEEAVSKLRPCCGLVLLRHNLGYDFGAYRDGIQLVPDIGALDSLLLANDSVYGPFHPLRETLDRMSPEVAPVWGLTDSMEGRFHLQSYFLLFHRAALRHEAFGRFWAAHRNVQSRYWSIVRNEFGLTRALMNAGLQCRARYPSRQLTAATPTGGPDFARNPMHELWEVLIGELGCPFIKRDLLRAWPATDPKSQRWRTLVESVSDYDTSMIPGAPEGG